MEIFYGNEIKLTLRDLPAVHEMQNQVRVFSASEGYRLLKIRAEARLCQGLIIGLVVAFTINFVFLLKDFTTFAIHDLISDRALYAYLIIISIATF